MGWDNTTEMLAGILDQLKIGNRMFYNANAETPDRSEIDWTRRPYSDDFDVEPESVSLADFAQLMNGG